MSTTSTRHEGHSASEVFGDRVERELRRVLAHLYDPSELRRSPLGELLGTSGQHDPIGALRRVLVNAIESLRPDPDSPSDSPDWRIYHVLRRRYTEQMTQERVAHHLGLSVRQLQRDDKRARQVLLDHLWSSHELESRADEVASALSRQGKAAPTSKVEMPTREQELAWLGQSLTAELADVGEVLEEVLATVMPLSKSAGVTLHYSSPEVVPRISAPRTVLQHALLNTLTTTIQAATGGHIHIRMASTPDWVTISAEADAPGRVDMIPGGHRLERLDISRRLAELAGGDLKTHVHGAREELLTLTLTLPAALQAAVLVIDDNSDTRRLFERYLLGSPYIFLGAGDPERGLTLAREAAPDVIVLDVMIPGIDGWKILAHLRQHPGTRDVPVVVCTILPEEELALTLGASEFMRKPVRRSEFLAMLSRHAKPSGALPR